MNASGEPGLSHLPVPIKDLYRVMRASSGHELLGRWLKKGVRISNVLCVCDGVVTVIKGIWVMLGVAGCLNFNYQKFPRRGCWGND